MADEFKVGDVVRLKSGGPRMTIEELGDYSTMGVAGHDQAKCVWFEGTKHLRGVFEFASLETVGPDVMTAPVQNRRTRGF
jgi:uncharacterized protein YodC (DUF2158 family)